jgi:DNA polymerase-3 subunit delta
MIPVYLFLGPEFGLRNEAIEKQKIDAEKKFGTLDYHLLYAQDVSLGEVLSILQGGSLFANARFVVLRNTELIKNKDDIELLRNWIEGLKSQKYDVICANIVADVIIAFLPLFKETLIKEGKLLLSGIIKERLEDIETAVNKHGFEILEIKEKNGWCAVILTI